MPTHYCSSRDECDLVVVELLTAAGKVISRTLFVDSGFTGQSSFILSDRDSDLSHAPVAAAQAAGALQGMQNRGVVVCQIPTLSFQQPLVAIFADLSQLSLPSGVEGMVGLRFLRQFASWGSEKQADGTWNFFVSDGKS